MDDFCDEFANNSALYMMAAFMIVIQFFVDHASLFINQYRKYLSFQNPKTLSNSSVI